MVEKQLRPFFPFYGSKWNIARHYPAPAVGSLVVEPFAGGAGYATFFGCPHVLLVDADPVIVGVWRYLMSVSIEEILALPELPEVGDSVDNYALPEEAKWLIGFWLNRGSATPKKSRTGARAKQRIASQLPALAGWRVQHGDYTTAPPVEATWFIDPPYGDKGRFYRVPFNDFPRLSEFCRSRKGLVIACEGAGADWLPFVPLGSFKSSKGRAAEAVYVSREAGRLALSNTEGK